MKKTNSKTKTAKQKTNNILAILTLITLAITTIIIGQFLILDHNINKVLSEGTVINGLNLSGMSKDEAEILLVDNFKTKSKDFELTINNGEDSWNLSGEDFKVNSDIHTILEVSQDRDMLLNNKEAQVDLISQFEKTGGSINVAFNYMFVGLDEKIEEIISSVEVEPIDSQIEFNVNSDKIFNITESVSGKRVDRTTLYNDINEQFLSSNKINVDLKFIEEIPTITKEYNENLTRKISSFSTNVADSTGGRKHNVKLALSKFNGMIIEPNQEISFNMVTGPHTLEAGYKPATIIYNGEFTEGIGGGICQASTTLYNALLTAGIEILEVHKHTLPVRYVPFGLDAMVSEYTSDLRFKNTSDYPIYIHTSSDTNAVYVELYSHPLEYTYKTRSETIDTIKSAGDKIIPDTEGKYTNKVLFKGEYFRISYPKDGYEAKAYLQKYSGDELIEEKEIRHEVYQPQRGVVIEGTATPTDGMTIIDSGVDIITSDD